MALVALNNPSFETGDTTGWDVPSGLTVTVSSVYGVTNGTVAAQLAGTPGSVDLMQAAGAAVWAGKTIQASCDYSQGSASSGRNTGSVILKWFDGSGNFLTEHLGNVITSSGGNRTSTVTGTAPAGAATVKLGLRVNKNNGAGSAVDNFRWNFTTSSSAVLTFPVTGSTYSAGASVPFRVAVTSDFAPTTVSYSALDISTATVIPLGTSTEGPSFPINYSTLPAATYSVSAVVTLSDGSTVTTLANALIIGTVPPADKREYRASNSYTYLVGEGFTGLGGAIPPTAMVTGAEVIVGYSMQVLTRARDRGVSPELSTPSVAFSVVQAAKLEATLMNKSGDSYTVEGTPMLQDITVDAADFTEVEEGTSGGTHRWAVYSLDVPASVTVGAPALLFGQGPMAAADFVQRAIALRFYPVLSAMPEYAAYGDACYRFKIDTFKLRVYFDAGSVEYYFDTGSGTVKAELGASYVTSGSFPTGDAKGVMQLLPDLSVLSGGADTLIAGMTIHSANPPTPANQIAVVAEDMEYNGLPTYYQTEINRSRYQFITANFYGDPLLDSIYGANGVDRGFAYNGDYFYKIFTHPDLDKDKPRHVAFHHSHLALGYGEGRVDLSVVGEPYNFDGAMGASSWAIGDSVTGLLPLSGTMLGMFCKKSVWGLSGTTVDNFATQVISPKLGAVEYTVTDMGFPVYANAYGVYTLEQTNSYGDFLGNPMSQSVSPWLRPRLVRSATSDKEVVVAWPVRSKNQYKLAFADGYVLTMTMNYGTQQTPTFSKQKYFLFEDAIYSPDWAYPSIVPAAISSELDDSGEERIHVANKTPLIAPPDPPADCASFVFNNDTFYLLPENMQSVPAWFTELRTMEVDFYDDGNWVTYGYNTMLDVWEMDNEAIYAPASGRGTMRQSTEVEGVWNIVCVDWSVVVED